MTKHTLIALLFLMGSIFGMASYAHALGIDLSSIAPIKKYDTPTLDDFKTKAKQIKEKSPYGEDVLGYEFWLPKEWTDNVLKTTASYNGAVSDGNIINDSIFSMLARHVSDTKNLSRSYLTIEGQKLGYEIKAKHWFVSQILAKGLSLSSLTEVSDKEVDGLYVELINDTSFIVRARVIINGDKIIIVRYYLPQDNYDAEKIQQAKVVESFNLLNVSKDSIEKRETFGLLDQSYFDYPSSWRLKERPILTIERMSVLLFQETMQRDELVLEGHIRINSVSRLLNTTLSQEVQKYRQTLKISDYKVGKLIEKMDFKKDPSIKLSKTEFYKLVPNDSVNMRQYELMITILQSDDYHYIISMISPSRDLDFYGWAKNIEVAKIIVESLRRNKVQKIVDPNDPYFDYLKEAQ